MVKEKIKNENQKRSLTINNTVEELIDSIKNILPTARDKLNKFVYAFEEDFPSNKPSDKGCAEALTWALMDGPLLLHAFGMNGSVIIELHGILEAFSARDIVNLLPVPTKDIIKSRIIKRCTLSDLALILRDLKIWDEKDVKFVEKLKKLRNGMAHKNPKLISNAICSGKEISMLDIDSVMANVDCIPLIIMTIQLLCKIATANKTDQSL